MGKVGDETRFPDTIVFVLRRNVGGRTDAGRGLFYWRPFITVVRAQPDGDVVLRCFWGRSDARSRGDEISMLDLMRDRDGLEPQFVNKCLFD